MNSKVLWICDERNVASMRAAVDERFPNDVVVPVTARTLHRTLRIALQAHPNAVAFNCCGGNVEDEQAASSQAVQAILERSGVVVAGTPSSVLSYDAADIEMLLRYGGVLCTPRAVVRAADDTALDAVPLPCEVSPVDPMGTGHSAATTSERHLALSEALAISPAALVAYRATDAFEVRVAVIAGNVSWWADTADDGVAALARAVGVAVLGSADGCLTTIVCRQDDRLAVVRVDVQGPHWAPAVLTTTQLSALIDAARAAHDTSAPRHRVAHTHEKGHHVVAARSLAEGEVVFHDEGRSFSLVTRPHVERQWSDAQRALFREYAWPVDDGAHVYAVWEEHPKRWRPINHACDPNCVFAAPHSLNVIAARPIAEGDDLTMDYATFCDTSMRPFQCFCGSPKCRGTIHPTEDVLRLYGAHAFHRRLTALGTK